MSALDIAKARLAARAREGFPSLNSFISSPNTFSERRPIPDALGHERNETNELNGSPKEPSALEARTAPTLSAHDQAPSALRTAPASERTAAAPEDWPASAWQQLHQAALDFWRAPRRDNRDGTATRYDNPDNLAYSDIADRWRRKHWRKPAPGVCAGCGDSIAGGPALELGGYAVHQDRDPNCLILHHRQWRAEARAVLLSFGISAPPADDASQ